MKKIKYILTLSNDEYEVIREEKDSFICNNPYLPNTDLCVNKLIVIGVSD